MVNCIIKKSITLLKKDLLDENLQLAESVFTGENLSCCVLKKPLGDSASLNIDFSSPVGATHHTLPDSGFGGSNNVTPIASGQSEFTNPRPPKLELPSTSTLNKSTGNDTNGSHDQRCYPTPSPDGTDQDSSYLWVGPHNVEDKGATESAAIVSSHQVRTFPYTKSR